MVTAPQLIRILNIPDTRAAMWQPALSDAMDEFEINTPLRSAHFLAQIGHESGGLKYTKEIWTNSPAQQSYEMASRLGNTEPGDGEKFMGRGPPQLTGRKNYRLCGEFLGVDLLSHPQLLERVDYGSRAACWFWKMGAGLNLGRAAILALNKYGMGAGVNLNDIADRDDVETITLCINGGMNGFEQRCAILRRAFDVLGIDGQTGGTATWIKV